MPRKEMVKLTSFRGEVIYINPSCVSMISKSGTPHPKYEYKTDICLNYDNGEENTILVKEDIETVLHLLTQKSKCWEIIPWLLTFMLFVLLITSLVALIIV